jgi:hypothetical protein
MRTGLKSPESPTEGIVTVYPIALTEDEFWDAIHADDDIEVGHMIDVDADHRWKLKTHEKERLRKTRTS